MAAKYRGEILIYLNCRHRLDGRHVELGNQHFSTLLSNATLVLVWNPVNLGAAGSLLVNLDFSSSVEWVMTRHQDDEYSPDHLEEHLKIMDQASASLGMISSESRSFSSDVKELSYPRGA